MRSAILLVACLLISPPQTANAQYWGDGCSYRVPGYPMVLPSFAPAPPYFALHPPVYYGQRYTRPYGVSPFASGPMLQSNPGYAPRPAAAMNVRPPLVIANPHYQAIQGAPRREVAKADQAPVVAKTGPQVIDNPFTDRPQVFTAK